MKKSLIDSHSSSSAMAVSDSETRRIFENVFDLYGELDCGGRTLNLAGRIFDATNTNPELLIGQQFSQTVFWQSSENTSKILDKAIESAANGENTRLLLDFRVSADEKRAIELCIQPIDRPGGERIIVICAQTVAERKNQIDRYKQESEHLLAAAEYAEIGLWFRDYSEERIYSTPNFNELFERAAYEILTFDTIIEVIHPEDRTFVTDFLERSRDEGSRYEEEFRVVYSDGTIEWICAEGRSFLDDAGQPQRMMGVVRKITERKLAAAELEKVYDREKRARAEAVEANRAKDFFLAFVSHELRSPLNAILGWSKILLTKTVDETTQKNALETIERSARFQTKLIDDLVDSARVASGKLRLEYRLINLFEVIKNSYQAQKPAADGRKITFEMRSDSEDIPVFGDGGRLQQVFSNLISNALKFTPIEGSVAINVAKNSETVRIEVSDTGHGIDSGALPNIFRQFSQGDVDQAKSNTGLGLGLSIVKILVTKHGGFVAAESSGVGKGSTFIVTLPLSDGEPQVKRLVPQHVATDQKPLNGVRILMVEDDSDSREVVHLFLEQNGAKVKSFESAAAAYKELTSAASLPDIIISDIAMPDEDGYSFITRVRGLSPEKGGTVPGLALSAFTTVESKQKAFDSGFDKYCTKPFEPDVLINDISELIRQKIAQETET